MDTATPAGLPHRSVTSIRGGSGVADRPSPPTTPSRPSAGSFSSPSTLRAEEDLVIVEIGSRFVRVGFAGDNAPKAYLQLRPDQQRRVGDYRMFLPGYHDAWRKRPIGKDWGKDYELWQYDLRESDLGLVQDKLDRILRDAFSRLLLIDSRPRRMALIVPSSLPLPLLSTTLDIFFKRFGSPIVSLLSAPVMSTVGAGVRSGLVVDLGWSETTVSSVYEYREVRCTRSIRGSKLMIEELHNLLKSELIRQGYIESPAKAETEAGPHTSNINHVISFEDVEEVAKRMLWCRAATGPSCRHEDEGLATVQEQDETEEVSGKEGEEKSEHSGRTGSPWTGAKEHTVEIPLRSFGPHCSVSVSFERLAEVCETAYFERQYGPANFDDDEMPLHLLIYNHLLRLPMDIRAVCMSRMMFVGGGSHIIGLKGRIFAEVEALIEARGWDPVRGRGAEAYKSNTKLQRRGSKTDVPEATTSPVTPTSEVKSPSTAGNGSDAGVGSDSGSNGDEVWHDAANAEPEKDAIGDALDKIKPASGLQGQLRALDTIGPWCGGSLACYLKVMAIATVDKEAWLANGLAGASRASEVDVKAQRQSMGMGGMGMGSGGLMRAAANIQEKSWTLGAWGAI
ncbi:Actin-related protein 10 [Ceratocystis platani]|uniref:Actin-related protein 10 n=1 Tax=Ceratocystis fimbriata f. sp. platani TaxID=88771 RepID=A0A0F8B3P3_CERFI|nr:Actin-related protein 10 [Ceratocystis platani]